jgi:serine/threonine-protein kinase
MPDLVDRTDADAQEIIRSLGLVPNVVSEVSDTVEQGKVVRQSPVADAKYSKGDTVTIYVSSGAEKTVAEVPNLLGKTEEEAKAMLLEVGLTWGNISTIESSRAKGTVVAQSLPAGVEVKTNTSIDLRLSSGPKTSAEPSADPSAAPTDKPVIRPVAPNA